MEIFGYSSHFFGWIKLLLALMLLPLIESQPVFKPKPLDWTRESKKISMSDYSFATIKTYPCQSDLCVKPGAGDPKSRLTNGLPVHFDDFLAEVNPRHDPEVSPVVQVAALTETNPNRQIGDTNPVHEPVMQLYAPTRSTVIRGKEGWTFMAPTVAVPQEQGVVTANAQYKIYARSPNQTPDLAKEFLPPLDHDTRVDIRR